MSKAWEAAHRELLAVLRTARSEQPKARGISFLHLSQLGEPSARQRTMLARLVAAEAAQGKAGCPHAHSSTTRHRRRRALPPPTSGRCRHRLASTSSKGKETATHRASWLRERGVIVAGEGRRISGELVEIFSQPEMGAESDCERTVRRPWCLGSATASFGGRRAGLGRLLCRARAALAKEGGRRRRELGGREGCCGGGSRDEGREGLAELEEGRRRVVRSGEEGKSLAALSAGLWRGRGEGQRALGGWWSRARGLKEVCDRRSLEQGQPGQKARARSSPQKGVGKPARLPPARSCRLSLSSTLERLPAPGADFGAGACRPARLMTGLSGGKGSAGARGGRTDDWATRGRARLDLVQLPAPVTRPDDGGAQRPKEAPSTEV